MRKESSRADRLSAAAAHLAASDPDWGTLIDYIGPCGLVSMPQREPYEALVRAVAHQQLHGRAAEAILDRFLALHPGTPFPLPQHILATDENALRACGFFRRQDDRHSRHRRTSRRGRCTHAPRGGTHGRRRTDQRDWFPCAASAAGLWRCSSSIPWDARTSYLSTTSACAKAGGRSRDLPRNPNRGNWRESGWPGALSFNRGLVSVARRRCRGSPSRGHP